MIQMLEFSNKDFKVKCFYVSFILYELWIVLFERTTHTSYYQEMNFSLTKPKDERKQF